MSFPPPGYDDESVIPQNRMRTVLGDFESELDTMQALFFQSIPVATEIPEGLERHFFSLRSSAEELGAEYLFLVEKLISDYESFQDRPNQDQLDLVFHDLKSLQLLLVG